MEFPVHPKVEEEAELRKTEPERSPDPYFDPRYLSNEYKFLEPYPERVIVLQDEALGQIGRLILPDTAKRRPTKGIVVSVGSGVVNTDPGDEVVFAQFSGTLLKFKKDEREFVMLTEAELVVKVHKDLYTKSKEIEVDYTNVGGAY
jgi:chaperonin GroES